jgi:AcrR family transcriptional regulator
LSTRTADKAHPRGTKAAGPVARPLRADAVRNRERVIDAARQELAECGLDAQMEDVARRAGVGVGTVYRHFTTKEALIDAALVARFEEALAYTREAEQLDDAWEGVVLAFHRAAELNVRDRGFCGTIGTQLSLTGAVRPVLDELLAVWGRLIVRAQRQGAMRRDVGAQDIPGLMCALANVVSFGPDRSAWERYMTILIDGLRPPGAAAGADAVPNSP